MTNAETVVRTLSKIRNSQKREYALRYLDFIHTQKPGEFWDTSDYNPKNSDKNFTLGMMGRQAAEMTVRGLLEQFGTR